MKKVLILLLALHLSEGFLSKLLKNDGWSAGSLGLNTEENNDEGPRKITYQAVLSSDGSSKQAPKDPSTEADQDEAVEVERAEKETDDNEGQNKTNTEGEGVRKMSRGSFQGSVSAGSSGSQVLTQLVSQFVPTDYITKMVMDQFIPRNVQDFLGNFAGTFGIGAGRLPNLGQVAKGFFDLPGKMLSTLVTTPGQQTSARKRNLSPIEQIIEVIFSVVQGISDFISSVANFISRMLGMSPSFNNAIKGVSDQMLALTKDLMVRVTRDVLTAGFKPFMGMGIKKRGKRKIKRTYTPSY